MKDKIAGILAVMFGAAVVAGTVLGKVPWAVLTGFLGVAVTYFFKEREEAKKDAQIKKLIEALRK